MDSQGLAKFHHLPENVRSVLSSSEALEAIERLEAKYGFNVSDLIIRLMIGEMSLAQLSQELRAIRVEPANAEALVRDLRQLLQPVLPYLEQQNIRPRPVSATGKPTPKTLPRPVPPPTTLRPTPPLAVSLPVRPAQPAKTAPPPPTLPSRDRLDQPSVTQPSTLKQATRPVPAPVKADSRVQPPVTRRPTPIVPHKLIPIPRAKYFVHAEDEMEIAKHRDRLTRVAGASPTARIASFIADLKDRYRLNFPDPTLDQRFHSTMLSRLRDIRTSSELSTLLTSRVTEGGLALSAQLAQEIVRTADEEALKLHDSQRARHLATPPPPPAPPPPKPVPPPPPPPIPVIQRFPAPTQPSARRPAPLMATGRKMVADVKRPARPMSMVDELGSLSIDEFRSLGQRLVEAAGKVLEKINLLGEESFLKRSEGVAAWRKSPVHRLYLEMGRKSMATGQSIETIMDERKKQGLPYLTTQEFAIIADLNRHISL